jgi:hypothetical protein
MEDWLAEIVNTKPENRDEIRFSVLYALDNDFQRNLAMPELERIFDFIDTGEKHQLELTTLLSLTTISIN